MGAAHVLDYHQADWPDRVRALTDAGRRGRECRACSGPVWCRAAVRDGGHRPPSRTSSPALSEPSP